MITFLWMLYLAFTLFCTIQCIACNIGLLTKDDANKWVLRFDISTCILWAVWYFYFIK